ncbi:MAG: SEC-C domain-containing protein [Deltaproteobacteria bacterium]|nr:SEC-C domain-containing protein [Deltaproteobacteria bacterium]
MKTRRNDPCFCGSGKKYKKCCMIRAEGDPLQGVKNDVHDLLDGRSFDSMEELQALIDRHSQQKNSASMEEFHGLSPDQMHRFLYMPFESPELVIFQRVLQSKPQSKAAFLISMLVEEVGEAGIRLTAKSYLGQKFCQKASKTYFDLYPESVMSGLSVRTETNFEPLHTIHLTAQLAGLVRKYKGRLLLTKRCVKSMERNGTLELYPLLMHAYIHKFNWGYRDGYGEVTFIQQSFLFTLYLLDKYGKNWRPATFYSDNFLRAFPMILREFESKFYEPPEDTLRKVYILRVLQRFAGFFGLADIEQVSKDPINPEYRVRATSLLTEVVEWNL